MFFSLFSEGGGISIRVLNVQKDSLVKNIFFGFILYEQYFLLLVSPTFQWFTPPLVRNLFFCENSRH